MQNLFRQLLAHLKSKDCEEDFISIIELPLVEAVMNHFNGDIKRASKALKISENSLANKLRRDFGTKDIGKYQVLLRKLLLENKNKRFRWFKDLFLKSTMFVV